MRVMFTTFGSRGHFLPLVPLAAALSRAGHDVVVVSGPGFRGVVEAEGLAFMPAGMNAPDVLALYLQRYPEHAELPAAERDVLLITHMFCGIAAPALLADAKRLVDWNPDVVVREEGEFAAPILAALAGVPCAEHSWGPVRARPLIDAAAAASQDLWRAHGLIPDPTGGFHHWLYLDICPPSLQFPEADEIPVRHPVRPEVEHTGETPDWLGSLADREVVYVTLGTVPRYNADVPFFLDAIEALQDFDVDVVVTVGPTGDPAALGPQPASVHVERFVPQAVILPRSRAVITNGGSGSTIGALAHGVPVLCVPGLSPSQDRNAEAVVRSGAGRRLARSEVSSARLRDELSALLGDPGYGNAARRIQAEVASMPPMSVAVLLLERLARVLEPLEGDGSSGALGT